MPSMATPDVEKQQVHGGKRAGHDDQGNDSKLYEFKEQILLLSTLVATVTYVAGLNLPGGSWEQDNPEGRMAGDPILRDTHYRRYLSFYYCNAAALAASLVVSLIVIVLPKKKHYWTVALRMVMMLDLLGLMGAYGAGSCRDTFTTIYAVVIFSSLVLIIIFVSLYVWRTTNVSSTTNGDDVVRRSNPTPNGDGRAPHSNITRTGDGGVPDSNEDGVVPDPNLTANGDGGVPHSNTRNGDGGVLDSTGDDDKVHSNSTSKAMMRFMLLLKIKRAKTKMHAWIVLTYPASKRAEKEQIDVLMLLATFAVTITYVAGLSPPGGFWTSTQDGHRLSDPVLQARGRYRSFFVCNTTSFAVSLLIIVLLLERKLLKEKLSKNFIFMVGLTAPYVLIAIALLGLMGAYAAGGCRESDNTALVLAVPAGVCLLLGFVTYYDKGWKLLTDKLHDVSTRFRKLVGIPSGTCRGTDELHQQNTRYLVMLLATLVVTITYQAGLDPPGGLWLDNRDGHEISHPVLQMTHPTRYRVFFYSNSAAFVTSLVVIMMLQSKFLLNRHTLEATLVLDLFGLVTAYGAGCTRDVNTSIYIVALAGLVLVYVIVHITIRDHAPEPAGDHAVKDLDDKRKVLLLVAILAATLTYQAGLTPPGGFWLADDRELGRRAGFPILHDNYPRRYNAFFYCNATSFMASITLILLLVNPKLYRPGIRCYALYVCMLVGMFGLMGAYAAGSARQLKTSIYVLTLVGMVLAFIAFLVGIFWFIIKSKAGKDRRDQAVHSNSGSKVFSNTSTRTIISTNAAAATTTTTTITITTTTTTRSSNNHSNIITTTSSNINSSNNKEKEKETVEYLMLLGILGASMTYQIGLKPPGGLWQDNNIEHLAGYPVLHDINKHRYDVFFYSNSTSFMASVVVIVLLLPWTTFQERKPPLWLMHIAVLLDMVGLLVAYAAGSTRKWGASRNVIFLVIPVLAYIALYATALVFFPRGNGSCWKRLASWWFRKPAILARWKGANMSSSSECCPAESSSVGITEVAISAPV
ncbi:uncharacterized protein LOC123411971 [Hordeum vulgare subsp. vulgare]|uniref:PGG domain-containing protein n=1 Tax=Hordeum vulgare subsp. vulgare TaxID=112509 RepID=A0A8I6YHV7_HORVV|nr:uncharacterized protein LOC123411971 [Hordeum vulgare subsp. vulgare]